MLIKTFLLFIFLIGCFTVKGQNLSDACGFVESYESNKVIVSKTPNASLKKLIEEKAFAWYVYKLYLTRSSLTVQETDCDECPFKYAGADSKYIDTELGSKRVLYYEPKSLNEEVIRMGDGWVLALIILHEFGHFQHDHINYYATTRHNMELEADEFAGAHLGEFRRNGGSVDSTKALLAYNLVRVDSNGNYPSRQDRIDAFLRGWKMGMSPDSRSPLYAIALNIRSSQNLGLTMKDSKFSALIKRFDLTNVSKAKDMEIIETTVDTTIKSKNLQSKFLLKDNMLLYKENDSLITILGYINKTSREGFKSVITDKYLKSWFVNNKDEIYYIDRNEKIRVGTLVTENKKK